MAVLTASWPIVVITCPPALDLAWIDALDRSFARDVFARREPFVIVTDTTVLTTMPGAKERRRIADWASRPDHLELQKQFCVGSSTILASAMIRGTLQAIYWLYTPPAPQHVARHFDEAWAWATSMLDARGVALPMPSASLRRIADHEIEGARTSEKAS